MNVMVKTNVMLRPIFWCMHFVCGCCVWQFEEGFKGGLDDAMKKYRDDENKRRSVDGLQSGVGQIHVCSARPAHLVELK